MKFTLAYIIGLIVSFCLLMAEAAEKKVSNKNDLLLLSEAKSKTIDKHEQVYGASCIPSAVEMTLKLTGKAPVDFYDLQNEWKNKLDGNFRDFDGKTIRGVTFRKQFGLARNDQFPLEDLFSTIDRELSSGRFVIISLASSSGWHMYVIYEKRSDGEYSALSKAGPETIFERNVKRVVTKMKGTDILTYEISSKPEKA